MCSENKNDGKLKKRSPAYNLAKELALKLPSLDPDSNKTVIITNKYKITTGMVIEALYKNFGKNIKKLKESTAILIREKIVENADISAQKKMLLMAAQKAGTLISKTEIDSLLNSQYDLYGGKEKFLEQLNKNEISIDFVVKDYQESYLIQRFLEESIAKEIQINEDDIFKVRQENEMATIRHILLRTQGKNELEREKILNQMNVILQKAKKGEEFAELAKKFSEYPGAKDNGGLIENFKRGDMLKSIADAVFSIPLGSISNIVETELGYHIIQVIKRTMDQRTNSIIIAEITNQKRQAAIQGLIDRLKTDIGYKKIGL
jgi:foldase protein PrsA